MNIGERMKKQYEDRTRYLLPRRTYTIIRVDGKSFHQYTKYLERPFDKKFAEAIDLTAAHLCRQIQGSRFAFAQSDEISILATDFENTDTDAWFDGNIQKIASVSASVATFYFSLMRKQQSIDIDLKSPALFDARVFTIPDPIEVENYFVWRQRDAVRNSISMAAQAVYSHKDLENVTCAGMQELLHKVGINWNDYDSRYKRGGLIAKVETTDGEREYGRIVETPDFLKDREMLRSLISIHGYGRSK